MNEVLKIDNESLDLKTQIDKSLDNAEIKARINEAVGMLRIIDSQIPDFDIDMIYDRKNDKFYFVSWSERLNIPLKTNEIQKIWETLVRLLNNKNKLWITWKQDFRRIYEVTLFWSEKNNEVFYKWTKFEWNSLNMEKAIANNNSIEEMYKFTQKLKWIPEKDWIIKWWIWTSKDIWFI